MREVGADEVRTRLAQLLDEVEQGEEITITRRGVPVARLTPVRSQPKDLSEVIEQIRQFGKGRTLGISIREAIDEGRRF